MSRFKTELCNNLIELGSCKYGDRCHYAHGAHELRQVSRRHPKYRTERCKNFELTGKCPFGPRCSYVHPKPDLDSMIEQLTKYMNHTKAPKPDSDDDDGMSLFTRTDTSLSTCDSIFANDDDNKENLPTGDYQPFTKLSSNQYLNRSLAFNDNTIVNGNTNSSTSSLTPLSINKTHNTNVSSQATISSSILRTPLGSHHNRSNILTPINVSNNFQANDHQVNSSTNTTNDDGTCNSNNFSFFEATSLEPNKKSRLIKTYPSNSGNTASNPFGISNPLSDYLNSTNINGRSPVQPKKQFYTRF